jgi:hypothetical protein
MKITPAMLVLVALGFGRCGVHGALSRYLDVFLARDFRGAEGERYLTQIKVWPKTGA